MAIYYCQKCSNVKEVPDKYIDKKAKCQVCEHIITVYQVEKFVTNLLSKYKSNNQKLKNLLEEKEKVSLPKEEDIKPLKIEDESENPLKKFNIDFTKKLTHQKQYQKIKKWFDSRNMKVEIDIGNVDTTGFFDEVALSIGDNYKNLKPLIDQIKYVQKKEYSNVKFKVANKNAKEISQITSFCKELYNYSFVSKYFYDKKLKIIRLNLQTVPKVKAFFNSVWMEWFIMMKLLKLFQEKNKQVSLMRSVKVTYSNGQENELDIFLLTENNKAIYIECKTGEFREDVNKYLQLQKKLGINKEHFIICVLEISSTHSAGLSTMYDLNFLNEENILEDIANLI
ncbi:MAG: hypothetical protein QM493_07325 [Sulfurovum sp.]